MILFSFFPPRNFYSFSSTHLAFKKESERNMLLPKVDQKLGCPLFAFFGPLLKRRAERKRSFKEKKCDL